jgi:hypothetical protein
MLNIRDTQNNYVFLDRSRRSHGDAGVLHGDLVTIQITVRTLPSCDRGLTKSFCYIASPFAVHFVTILLHTVLQMAMICNNCCISFQGCTFPT